MRPWLLTGHFDRRPLNRALAGLAVPKARAAQHDTRTSSPLAEAIAEQTTPELQYLEAKFAGLASYGLSAELLAEVLPLGRPCMPAPCAATPK